MDDMNHVNHVKERMTPSSTATSTTGIGSAQFSRYDLQTIAETVPINAADRYYQGD